MGDILGTGGIPLAIDGSILAYVSGPAPVETIILETITSLPTGGATSGLTATTWMAQTFLSPQAITGDFQASVWGNVSGVVDFDLTLQIVGVVGDVSTGTPYYPEVIGTSNNTISIEDASSGEGYLDFNFSGITLQDASSYAIVAKPSNIVSTTFWGWDRSPGSHLPGGPYRRRSSR